MSHAIYHASVSSALPPGAWIGTFSWSGAPLQSPLRWTPLPARTMTVWDRLLAAADTLATACDDLSAAWR